jgi:hypothetical protein
MSTIFRDIDICKINTAYGQGPKHRDIAVQIPNGLRSGKVEDCSIPLRLRVEGWGCHNTARGHLPHHITMRKRVRYQTFRGPPAGEGQGRHGHIVFGHHDVSYGGSVLQIDRLHNPPNPEFQVAL